MNKLRKQYPLLHSLIFILAFILFSQNESHADAINPILNIFAPDTAVPASILTALIILIEALLLRLWTKPISFRLCLWRATIINIISSAAGSIIAWLFFEEQMIWGMMELYVPMFILSLATETPALKLLYRREGLNWIRSIKVSFGINIISYLLVFIAQVGLIYAYIGYADFADKQTIKKWNDVSLLEGETGFIYTVKYSRTDNITKYVFNRYDVENRKWEIIDPGFERGIDPGIWDINGNIIACIIETVHWESRPITILNITTFSKLSEIEGKFRDARISPDLSKLAVFEFVREITAPRDDESDFMLGYACKLKIYDIESGILLYEAPRFALDSGLTWTNSSSDIIFSSLRDESLYQQREDYTPSHTYGRNYAESGQFPIDLFIFDLKSNSVRRLTEGLEPNAILGKNEITFIRESGFYSEELWRMDIGQINPRLILKDIWSYKHASSPDGDRYLILTPHKQPLSSSYFLTVVDPNNDEKKLIIDTNSYYGFRWNQK